MHHLFSKSVDMVFTGTVRINCFLEEHTNARWHVSKKVLQKNLLQFWHWKMKIVLLLPAATYFKWRISTINLMLKTSGISKCILFTVQYDHTYALFLKIWSVSCLGVLFYFTCLIWANYKFLSQLSQPISVFFSYLNSKQNSLVINCVVL